MTDFKNIQSSTQYAITAFFKHLYSHIPYQYRLHYELDEAVATMHEFFDQDLSVEGRLQYKITKIPYANRSTPWIALLWNTEGMQPSDQQFRRFNLKGDIEGRPHALLGTRVQSPITIAAVSNSAAALLEYQEVLWLGIRPDDFFLTDKHPIVGKFTTNITNFSMNSMQKLSRDKGTLASIFTNALLEYPIIGAMSESNIILSIYTDYHRIGVNGTLARDIIQPDENS